MFTLTQRRSATVLSIAAAALIAAATTATASTCVKNAGFFCQSVTTTSLNTTGPGPVCLAGDDWVQIDSSAQCLGLSAGPVRVIVCGSSNESITYSGNGFVHKLGVAKGHDWESIRSGQCKALGYKAGFGS